MAKKLLALLGSPHKGGSSAAMLGCATDAAFAGGWEVSTLYLYDTLLSPCRGCRACVVAGHCVIDDGIQEIEAQIRTCDQVVLASPTYWANVPAVVKNLFDRLLGTAMEDTNTFPKPRLSRKQSYLLFTACNTPFPFSVLYGQSTGTLNAMNEFFKTSGMRRAGSVVWPGARGSAELPSKIAQKIRRFYR